MAVSSDPVLSILIVNYNGAKVLPECLASIFRSEVEFSYEVIVVDNASADQPRAYVAPFMDRLVWIQNEKNEGFGKANNQAAQVAKGEYVFLLNSDTILDRHALRELMAFSTQTPQLGIAAPELLNPDGTRQQQGSWLGQWQYRHFEPKRVSFVIGAAMMVPATVYRKVGGFDEAFFFYNEDIDLCKTLLKKGFSIYYVPKAKVTHLGGQSTSGLSDIAQIEGFRGGLYLVYKHYPRWVYHLYRGVILGIACVGMCLPGKRKRFMAIAQLTWTQTIRYVR